MQSNSMHQKLPVLADAGRIVGILVEQNSDKSNQFLGSILESLAEALGSENMDEKLKLLDQVVLSIPATSRFLGGKDFSNMWQTKVLNCVNSCSAKLQPLAGRGELDASVARNWANLLDHAQTIFVSNAKLSQAKLVADSIANKVEKAAANDVLTSLVSCAGDTRPFDQTLVEDVKAAVEASQSHVDSDAIDKLRPYVGSITVNMSKVGLTDAQLPHMISVMQWLAKLKGADFYDENIVTVLSSALQLHDNLKAELVQPANGLLNEKDKLKDDAIPARMQLKRKVEQHLLAIQPQGDTPMTNVQKDVTGTATKVCEQAAHTLDVVGKSAVAECVQKYDPKMTELLRSKGGFDGTSWKEIGGGPSLTPPTIAYRLDKPLHALWVSENKEHNTKCK